MSKKQNVEKVEKAPKMANVETTHAQIENAEILKKVKAPRVRLTTAEKIEKLQLRLITDEQKLIERSQKAEKRNHRKGVNLHKLIDRVKAGKTQPLTNLRKKMAKLIAKLEEATRLEELILENTPKEIEEIEKSEE